MARTERSVLAGLGSPATAPTAIRGRGAVTHVAHRFQSDAREADNDVVAYEPNGEDTPPPLRTQVIREQARKLLSRNDSPDIPFDQAVNPYRGCEHGCVYCYARPTHAYLGYSPGLDFETKLIVKENAVDALRAELARPAYRMSPINVGSATDVYQPIEREWRLTRGILQLLSDTGHPLTLVTKNALVERDLDILKSLAERNLVAVYISVTSMDAELSRTMEPRASAPWRRLQAVRTLSDAGIPVGVLVAPVMPFINDAEVEHILEAAAEAGAYYANYTVVRLPWEVKEVFETWLRTHFPDRADRVLHRIEDLRGGKRNDPRFGTRMKGEGVWSDLLRQRFDVAVRRHKLNRTRLALDTTQFVPPVMSSAQSSAQFSAMPQPTNSVARGHVAPVTFIRSRRSSAPQAATPVSQLALFD
ncbi:PA0069 family radical SAM protein [Alcaligenaceae bacterium A4P071]|nr:PA0069 family radical SAM protein [Alcaligenaceae bacterium A4P071]